MLNLHESYRDTRTSILDAFAVIVRDADRGTDAYREAASYVRQWPGLEPALRSAQMACRRLRRGRRLSQPNYPGPCCTTDDQKRYVRRLYLHLNNIRFDRRVPRTLPLRLISRFRSRLRQMVPGDCADKRVVLEIALNVDLMMQGSGRERVDTIVHEMAHAAYWIF